MQINVWSLFRSPHFELMCTVTTARIKQRITYYTSSCFDKGYNVLVDMQPIDFGLNSPATRNGMGAIGKIFLLQENLTFDCLGACVATSTKLLYFRKGLSVNRHHDTFSQHFFSRCANADDQPSNTKEPSLCHAEGQSLPHSPASTPSTQPPSSSTLHKSHKSCVHTPS